MGVYARVSGDVCYPLRRRKDLLRGETCGRLLLSWLYPCIAHWRGCYSLSWLHPCIAHRRGCYSLSWLHLYTAHSRCCYSLSWLRSCTTHCKKKKKDLLSQRVHRKSGTSNTELGGSFLEPSLLFCLGFPRREHHGQDIHAHKQAVWCQCGPLELGWCPDRSLSPKFCLQSFRFYSSLTRTCLLKDSKH